MAVKPALSYVVCTAPRTGSSLLCAALAGTGVVGHPAEYFDIHSHNEAYWRQTLHIAGDADYAGKAIARGTTPNGVFGLKLHWHQGAALRAKLLADMDRPAGDPPIVPPNEADDSLHDLLTARLGPVRYIWLRRRNMLAQAISYYRASVTDIWRIPVSDGDTPVARPPVQFDFAAIQRQLALVEQFDRAWYAFFMRRRLPALIVVHEDFVQAYSQTIHGVLRFLGQDTAAITVPPPQFRRQADAESAEWEQRFRDMLKHGPEPRYTPDRKPRPGLAKRAAARQAQAALPMVAYDLASGIRLPMQPASPNRAWMDRTPSRFAYRCLPLVIANQAGWMVLNSHALTAEWDGTDSLDGVRVTYDDDAPVQHYATSHFGSGVLTFSLGYLFRTPPGWNLQVRGPANWPKDGICALDGIVETDWTHATFTMNWKLTRPGHKVRFETGEPVAMLAPVRRGEIERFRPQLQPIGADAQWQAGYAAWSGLRTTFNAALKLNRPGAVAAGWQRHYLLGLNPGDVPAPEHQTALTLAPFADHRTPAGEAR